MSTYVKSFMYFYPWLLLYNLAESADSGEMPPSTQLNFLMR